MHTCGAAVAAQLSSPGLVSASLESTANTLLVSASTTGSDQKRWPDMHWSEVSIFCTLVCARVGALCATACGCVAVWLCVMHLAYPSAQTESPAIMCKKHVPCMDSGLKSHTNACPYTCFATHISKVGEAIIFCYLCELHLLQRCSHLSVECIKL